jgi:hypothetical protein
MHILGRVERCNRRPVHASRWSITSTFAWVEHAAHGLVPEITFNVRGIKDLEVVDIADTPIERD